MKHINTIVIFFAFALLLLGGCEDTNVNLVEQRGVGVVPLLTNLNPAVFDSNDLQNTFVEFTVDVKDKSLLTNAIVKVSLNGKLERADYLTITTFPQTVKITMKDAAAKLNIGIDKIKLGDILNVEVWTTSNGVIHPTSAVFNASVVCPYFQNQIIGSYHSVSTDWATEGDITITADPTDKFIVYVSGLETLDGLNEDKGPLKMVIDPLDYSIKAVKTVLASLVTWGPPYHNIAYEGTGKLNTCNGTYEMTFDITVDEGGWTNNKFTFTKN
jgi:hypothetical protein